MNALKEFLFGEKRVEIVTDKPITECRDALERLYKPRGLFRNVGTNVEIRSFYSDQFGVEISRSRRVRFIRLRSVAFSGVIETDSKGITKLRGNVAFQEWYYIVIGLMCLATLIWLAYYPAYVIFAVIIFIIFLIFANWAVRSDKSSLLDEIQGAIF